MALRVVSVFSYKSFHYRSKFFFNLSAVDFLTWSVRPFSLPRVVLRSTAFSPRPLPCRSELPWFGDGELPISDLRLLRSKPTKYKYPKSPHSHYNTFQRPPTAIFSTCSRTFSHRKNHHASRNHRINPDHQL